MAKASDYGSGDYGFDPRQTRQTSFCRCSKARAKAQACLYILLSKLFLALKSYSPSLPLCGVFYKTLMMLPVNEEAKKDAGLKVLVVLYTITSQGSYNIVTMLEKAVSEEVISFLKVTEAKGSSSGPRVLWRKYESYDMLCTFCVSEKEDSSIRKAGAAIYRLLKNYGVGTIVLPTELKPDTLAEGALLASFDYDYLKKKKSLRMVVVPREENQMFQRASCVVAGQNFSRFLSNTPSNLMTPRIFTEYTRKYMKDLENIEILEYRRPWAEERRMGLFLAVANGSEEELRFLHIKYRGGAKDEVMVALVGKGITFDSGGISLKPAAKMGEMKMDMTGAASVVSTIGVLSKLRVKINVDAFVPLCENMPSGKATKPGDVAIASNGKSVEVENTDAEGRLILGDAILYAQEHNPRYVIDIATLTGAMSVALGSVYSGFFSNDNGFAELVEKAGNLTGDMVWRMPLHEGYRSQLDSEVADIKNVGTRAGGSCVAAMFLKEFVEKPTRWAHFDIAGTMCDSVFSEIYGKGSPGSGVRMLVALLESIANETSE